MKRPQWENLLRSALGLVLPVLLLAALSPFSAQAVTQADIDALKNQQSESQARQQELKDQLAAVKNGQARAEEQRNILTQQLEAIQAEIMALEGQIAWYESEIAAKEEERQAAVALEAEQYELFCQRVRSMEEDGNISYWSILFHSEDFSDMLDKLTVINDIMDYDNGVMDQLIATRQRIEQIKLELEEALSEHRLILAQQEAKKAELAEKVAEAQALLNAINADLEEVNRQLDAEDEAAAAIQAQIARKQQELEEQRRQNQVVLDPSALNTSSDYQWPLPSGNLRLTSAFGYRIHPVTYQPSNHTGIDVAASTGTPITACKGGQVITSVYGAGSFWSYGNYVVIDHGDGTTTLYAHMSSRAVREGDIVSQGQLIGYVGTTGRTSGPHLHLEVRVNGQRVDPETYFPRLYNSFIRAYNW